MAKNRDQDLFDQLRARGLRKKLAKSLATQDGSSRARPGREKLARQAVEDLTVAAESIRKRVLRSEPNRSQGAKKVGRTRVRSAAKRTATARKGAPTRAKVAPSRAKAKARRA